MIEYSIQGLSWFGASIVWSCSMGCDMGGNWEKILRGFLNSWHEITHLNKGHF